MFFIFKFVLKIFKNLDIMKTILMILAPSDFRDVEFIVPKAFWEQKGFKVVTASTEKVSHGAFGYIQDNDLLLEQVRPSNYDGLFFVGGYGSVVTYMENQGAKQLTQNFIEDQKPVGAICAAPRCFLSWGILSGKKMTGWNDDKVLQEMSKENQAIYTGDTVTVDGLFLTADGPTSSEECANKFAELL